MVDIMENLVKNPIQMDDLGVVPRYGKLRMKESTYHPSKTTADHGAIFGHIDTIWPGNDVLFSLALNKKNWGSEPMISEMANLTKHREFGFKRQSWGFGHK